MDTARACYPRQRGFTDAVAANTQSNVLLPAPAGIYRKWSKRWPMPRPVTRASGDLPQMVEAVADVTICYPRQRGLTGITTI